MSLIGAHNFFVVFDRTVAEVGFDGYASSVPEWAINGDDSSVRPNRYSELLMYRNNVPHNLLGCITLSSNCCTTAGLCPRQGISHV